MVKISSSILAADFSNLKSQIDKTKNTDYIHLDIMDGHFVPNISFGFPIIKSIAKLNTKPLDVHLMIEKLDYFIPKFITIKNIDCITFHYEVVTDHKKFIDLIKKQNIKAGISIKPSTPVSVLEPLLNDIDRILIMSVEPGFAFQKYIQNTTKKIIETKRLINGKNIEIEIDGGINESNIKKVVNAGCDIVVSGGTIFKANNPNLEIIKLKEISAQ
jgi:ribulose-phosphate 3-epimerase